VQAYSIRPGQGLTSPSRGRRDPRPDPRPDSRPDFRPDPRLEARLEALCEKGCRHVWGDIAALDRGEHLPETLDLTAVEVRWLLAELKQVMAVYGARCSAD
jgi:hypothetical protein